MASEIVEDGLPAGALLIYRVRGFRIERNAHLHTPRPGSELHFRVAIAKCELDALLVDNSRIDIGEIESKLPSFASMREENAPPSRRSTLAAVVCQSAEAAFHCLISPGVV